MAGLIFLAFVLLEIPFLLLMVAVKSAATTSAKSASGKSAAKTAPEPKATEKPEKAKPKQLSAAQRTEIIRAILDDSLLALDSAYDALYNEGEADFSAPDALDCSYKEFKQQYGSRKWMQAWENALASRFGCQCRHKGRGIFYIRGSVM